jgi:hypothetical protein
VNGVDVSDTDTAVTLLCGIAIVVGIASKDGAGVEPDHRPTRRRTARRPHRHRGRGGAFDAAERAAVRARLLSVSLAENLQELIRNTPPRPARDHPRVGN